MLSPRWSVVVALVLVVIATIRIVSTWTVFNHTIDEPDHLAAGMEYLSTGHYLYEDAHPPLARIIAAIGPFLAGERFHPGPGSFFEGYRILGHGEHYDRILALSRAGNLICFWIASLVTFLWGLRAGGHAAAVIATLAFTTLPTILAHAGLATTDMALCAMTAAAALASLTWADLPSRRNSVVLGILIALAFASKFSALLYLPAVWLLMILCYLAAARQSIGMVARELWARRRAIMLVLGISALTIWIVYGFTFGRVDFLGLRLPAPRFFSGIHSVWLHSQRGHPAYLLGQRSAAGFWYYFPTVLALKTPLAMLILVALSPWLLKQRLGAALAAAFSIGILLVSMPGHIDIGVRYLLPMYVGLAVVCGCVAAQARGWLAKTLVAGLLGWQVILGDLAHPDYLAYTNEITGGHPERFLADSDVDWGQDMKRLDEFLREQHAAQVTFLPFNRTYPMAGQEMIPMVPGDGDHPGLPGGLAGRHSPRRVRYCAQSPMKPVAFIFAAILSAQQQSDIRVDVDLVAVPCSVTDHNGAPAKDLRAEDFNLRDNGQPRKISAFWQESDLPLTIALVADVSGSQAGFIRSHREAVAQFLKQVIGPRDRAMIVEVARDARLISNLTNSLDGLSAAVEEIGTREGKQSPMLGPPCRNAGFPRNCGGTALWHGLYYTAKELKPVTGRKAIVVLSDGLDTGSDTRLNDLIEMAQSAEEVVYSIKYANPMRFISITATIAQAASRGLERLARETGGLNFPNPGRRASEVFSRIESDLRDMYVLGFTFPDGARDGTFHKLDVKTDRKDLVVRSRAGYWARAREAEEKVKE